jgi:hypothetical protein
MVDGLGFFACELLHPERYLSFDVIILVERLDGERLPFLLDIFQEALAARIDIEPLNGEIPVANQRSACRLEEEYAPVTFLQGEQVRPRGFQPVNPSAHCDNCCGLFEVTATFQNAVNPDLVGGIDCTVLSIVRTALYHLPFHDHRGFSDFQVERDFVKLCVQSRVCQKK